MLNQMMTNIDNLRAQLSSLKRSPPTQKQSPIDSFRTSDPVQREFRIVQHAKCQYLSRGETDNESHTNALSGSIQLITR